MDIHYFVTTVSTKGFYKNQQKYQIIGFACKGSCKWFIDTPPRPGKAGSPAPTEPVNECPTLLSRAVSQFSPLATKLFSKPSPFFLHQFPQLEDKEKQVTCQPLAFSRYDY